jgi:hypothetical protein
MSPNRRDTGVGHTASRLLLSLMLALAAATGLPRGAHAQWQTQTESDRAGQPSLSPSMPAPLLSPLPELRPTAPATVPPNTTVVPRSTQEVRPPPAAPAGGGGGQISLSALLTQDGQSIDQGLVWRVFAAKPGPDGKPRLLLTNREASPTLKLDPGEYLVNVAFGRANLTRKVTVAGDRAAQERFVLNAGGLRLTPALALARGETVNERAFVYDIYSDERDQYGQRIKVVSSVRPGVVLRLNAGIYNVVGTYGDANAIVRADVTVEAGKLTEATINHAAAKVTFKLVAQPGGDAIADTQWTVATAEGETVKESVGALPTHIFAPGTYVVSAKNGGGVFQRRFTVRAGDVGQVEVLRR